MNKTKSMKVFQRENLLRQGISKMNRFMEVIYVRDE